MAGGKGSRLGAVTASRPKPLIELGGKPMAERVLEAWKAKGFRHFVFTLNYLGDQIRDYFGDGRNRGVMIDYVEEPTSLGTFGILSLLPMKPTRPIMVVNCDVVTGLDFSRCSIIMEADRSVATMAVRDYVSEVPFGIVQTHGGLIMQISEKPRFTYQVAAGVYTLSPEALETIEPNTYLDMPTLFERLIAAGKQTRCHHVNSYCFDLGTIDQIKAAEIYLAGRGLL
ncbi:MAG: NTP transferase domain-containing protein [Hyphomicrobium sp.]|nr:NTP transferase domain-containing protein [Hyphomicrobium sp.]